MTSRFKKRLTRLHASRQRLHHPEDSGETERVYYAENSASAPPEGENIAPGTVSGGRKNIAPGTVSDGRKNIAPGTVSEGGNRPVVPSQRGLAWERLGAKSVETSGGRAYYLEESWALKSRHGGRVLGAGCEEARLLDRLVGEASLRGVQLSAELELGQIAFVDLETTGLSEQSYAFCIGVGFLSGDEFVVRQYLMTSADDEAQALLASVGFIAEFAGLCTFNGRSFDVPMLKRRCELYGIAHPFDRVAHIDLLRVSRRRLSGRRAHGLDALERDLLDFYRVGDVPGAQIPGLWAKYLQNGRAERLAGVFEHNQLDIVSMLALLPILGADSIDASGRQEVDMVGAAKSVERVANPRAASLRRAYKLRQKSSGAGAGKAKHSASASTGAPGPGALRRGMPLGAHLRELRVQVERLISQDPHAQLSAEAAALLHEMLAFAPAHPFALRHLADYYQQKGKPELAAPFLRRLGDASPF